MTSQLLLIEYFEESFNYSYNSEKDHDDFKEDFENSTLRLCWAMTILSNLIFSNILFYFLILFDQHGEDWAKRSLFNRLALI